MAAGRAPLLATLLKNGGDARLAGFFGRTDFATETGRGAALKNAYAAKAARRFGLAAACFLLAGAPDDAVAVCASEAGDPQLAALVAAVAGGGADAAAAARAAVSARAGADRAPWRTAALRAATGDAQGALGALLWLVEGGEGDGASPLPAAALPLLPALVRAGAAPPPAATFAALASLAATSAAPTAPLLAAEAAEAAVGAAGGADPAVAVAGAAVALADDATRAAVRASLPTVANAAAAAAAATQAASAAAHSAAAAAAAAAADADAALRSAARPALAARRARAPAPHAPPPGPPYGPPTTLIRLPGDRLHAIASAAGGAVDAPRAVAVATAGRGVVWLEWADADAAAADATPDAAGLSPRRRRSLSDTAFTAALGEALDSYEGDGWGGAQAGESQPAAPPHHSLPRVAATASDLAGCVALGAHPFRPLLLAGAPGGEVLLFQFGRRAALAAYTPLTPADGAGADSAAADASLFAAPAAAWHADATSAAAAWGVPQAAAFSRCGERAAALGALGGLALWSLDAPRAAGSPTGALGRAAWAARGLASRGATLAWIGASSSLVAVGGADAAGSVALWDARAPPDAGPSARAAAGGGPLVTALASLPGGRALVVGDEAGGLAAVDLRALGGGRCTARAVAWRAERGGGSAGSGGGPPASSDPGVTCAAAGVAGAHGAVVVVGDRGGGVRVLSGGDGALLQRLGPAQRSGAATPPSGVAGWLAGLVTSVASARATTTTAAPITGVTLCADGVAACSLDGVVRAWRAG